MKTAPILSLLLAVTWSSFAQTQMDTAARGTLNISSEPPGADVFLDSMFVGKTPIRDRAVIAGPHRVKIFYPSVLAWNAIAKEDTVRILPESKSEKIFELGSFLRIQSIPSGGMVLYHGSELGVTPLYYKSVSRLSGDLLVQKEGFDTQRVVLTGRDFDPILLRLQPNQRDESLPSTDWVPSDRVLGTSRNWLTYVSGSTMITSGILSAYLKDQANRDFDRYIETKDPALLSSTRRLDRAAAISLIVTQISFAVLSYLLLSE